MSLQEWLANGWLKKHTTSRKEIADLFAVVDRDLGDSRVEGLSPEGRLNHAYNAALQVAIAALAAEGYRPPSGEGHHYRALQSLAHTIGADKDMIDQLDAFRKKRNISAYNKAGMVSEKETQEMYDLALKLRDEVKKWLRKKHPTLL